MIRDLLDALRCPKGHAEGWLVTVVNRAAGTRLLDADLACPRCGAEFRVSDGIARFAGSFSDDPTDPASHDVQRPVALLPDATRLAAELGVIGGHLPVLLAGRYATAARKYADLTEVPVVVIRERSLPDDAVSSDLGDMVSVLEIGERLPLGVGTLAAAAIDHGQQSPTLLGSIARAVRVRGRLVAPVTLMLPPEAQRTVREIARDDHEWVAEVTVATRGLATLRMMPPAV